MLNHSTQPLSHPSLGLLKVVGAYKLLLFVFCSRGYGKLFQRFQHLHRTKILVSHEIQLAVSKQTGSASFHSARSTVFKIAEDKFHVEIRSLVNL